MQEVWIQDKRNPEAQRDPLKSYAIMHTHHHATVGSKEDITAQHLSVVDAINVRHLAPAGPGYQKHFKYQMDNPFFHTCIEPSGRSTLKVYPPEKEWTCGLCGQTNFQNKPECRGKGGASCAGACARRLRGSRWVGKPLRQNAVLRAVARAVTAPDTGARDLLALLEGVGGGDGEDRARRVERQRRDRRRVRPRRLPRRPAVSGGTSIQS